MSRGCSERVAALHVIKDKGGDPSHAQYGVDKTAVRDNLPVIRLLSCVMVRVFCAAVQSVQMCSCPAP